MDAGAYTAAMEALARVQMVPAIDIKAVASKLRQNGRGGALVLVTGSPDQDLLGVHRHLGSQHRVTVLLAASSAPNSLISAFQRLGAKTVVPGLDPNWAPAWNQTIGRTWLSASAG